MGLTMEKIFNKSKWIWLKESRCNQYVDFVDEFAVERSESLKLRISADTNYAVSINGKLVYAGQYPDYPHYKIFDEIDITECCVKGKNYLAVLCVYVGEDTGTYYKSEAGLIYEILSGEDIIAYSGPKTQSRPDSNYRSGEMEKISPQLGYTYLYDARHEDDWQNGYGTGFHDSVPVDKKCVLTLRPVERLYFEKDYSVVLRSQGEYYLLSRESTTALNIKNSFLKHTETADSLCVSLPKRDGYEIRSAATGCYVIADMSEEVAGFVYLDFEVEEETEVWIGFGEHLEDLRVRSEIGGRNFAVTYFAHKGRNVWCGYMRRLGLRYLQVMYACRKVILYDCRIIKTIYPVKELPAAVTDGLSRKIYENGVRTLRNCIARAL